MYHTNLFLRPAAFRLSPSGLEWLVDCGRGGSLRSAFGTTHLVTLTDAMKASLITSELGRIDYMRSRSGAKSHDENCALNTRSNHHLIPTSRILHQLEIDGMSGLFFAHSIGSFNTNHTALQPQQHDSVQSVKSWVSAIQPYMSPVSGPFASAFVSVV